ncbi:hypothetical protein [Bordetella genomosp. 10]|uniref:hypothetical protein n=1 Tax=Bordetella genomosp. 10 TaxID=1416804 RepID=UPI001177B07D|nr:hypothetical protein [Bordetella genomosp. 10]
MDASVVVAIISVSGTVMVSALTFFFTKQKEREAEWRKQKLDHYKEFMAALNDIVGPPPTTEEKVRFASAANNIFLVGSPSVLLALRGYLDETAQSNPNRRRQARRMAYRSFIRHTT